MSWTSPKHTGAAAPDLDVLSNDTPHTPATWTSYEDEPESKNGFDDSSDDLWQQLDAERRRSSGMAVQSLLAQIDGNSGLNSFDIGSAISDLEDDLQQPPSWKVVIETSFASKYFRNDRKNIQCFPACTLGAQQEGAEGNSGHGKSTTWCRGPVNARAFAIDPEINLADISMFEVFGAFVMGEENPKTVPLSSITDRVRGALRKVDGRSFEIKLTSTVWKFDPPLSKKKSDEQRNRCYFIVVVLFKGREVGRCVSPPFDLASQKAAMRLMKKRTMAQEDAWGAKHLVLDSFAQATIWAKQQFGYASPKRDEDNRKRLGDEKETDASAMVVRVDDADPISTPRYPELPQQTTLQNTPETANLQGDIENQAEPPLAVIVSTPRKQVRNKRISLTFLLWLPPFGLIGAHHIYLGRAKYALTSALTLNFLIIGWIVDALRLPMLVYSANFPDPNAKHGHFTSFEFFLLWLLCGLFGAHRYAVGEFGRGLLYTFTLGGLGMMWLWDGFHLDRIRRKTLA